MNVIWTISEFLLALLTGFIWLFTITVAAPHSIPAAVTSMFLPVVAQAYWIWDSWRTTGTLSHPLTVMCVAWLALLAIWLFAGNMARRSGPVLR